MISKNMEGGGSHLANGSSLAGTGVPGGWPNLQIYPLQPFGLNNGYVVGSNLTDPTAVYGTSPIDPMEQRALQVKEAGNREEDRADDDGEKILDDQSSGDNYVQAPTEPDPKELIRQQREAEKAKRKADWEAWKKAKKASGLANREAREAGREARKEAYEEGKKWKKILGLANKEAQQAAKEARRDEYENVKIQKKIAGLANKAADELRKQEIRDARAAAQAAKGKGGSPAQGGGGDTVNQFSVLGAAAGAAVFISYIGTPPLKGGGIFGGLADDLLKFRDDLLKGKVSPEVRKLGLDIVQFGLDIIGIFEPTPIADGTNTLISLARGDWLGAGLSALGIVPYVGDLAKAGKLGKYAKAVAEAVELAKKSPKLAKALAPGMRALRKIIATAQAIPKVAWAVAIKPMVVASGVPPQFVGTVTDAYVSALRSQFDNISKQIDEFFDNILPRSTWKSSNQWDTAENAKKLRESMGDAAKAGEDAHHVVLSTHKRAEEARKLLDKYQIDINDAVNGVSLKPSGSKPAHHGHGLHSHDAIDRVNQRLKDAVKDAPDWLSGRQSLLDELARLRAEIARGSFP
jgi:hypothetical protein